MIDLEKILELESKSTPSKWDVNIYGGEFHLVHPAERKIPTNIDFKLIDEMRNNIRQICLELIAARGAIELLENIEEFAWDVDREKSQEILYKYHEVTNEKC